MGMKLY